MAKEKPVMPHASSSFSASSHHLTAPPPMHPEGGVAGSDAACVCSRLAGGVPSSASVSVPPLAVSAALCCLSLGWLVTRGLVLGQ